MRLILSPEELRVLSSSLPALEVLSVNGHEYNLSDGLGGAAPSLAVDAPLDGIEISSGMDASEPTEADTYTAQDHQDVGWNQAINAVLDQLGIEVPGGGRIGQLQYMDVWKWHDKIEGLKK